ncbi:Asp23/Gls24 family envelope stress response protein [Rothia halotolerans]|uniref:Asp23/Gls24 family envelope stress response protein n=1 Tax=Rothia halotolerans TaxID=405770 RepID=UPI0013EAEF1E|nr:Asp23/Gls24 family envelope stress response protein [Rothia halotolerans]
MFDASTGGPGGGEHPPREPDGPASSSHRGHLVLAEKVVEKIAAQCASEITEVGGTGGGFLGMGRQNDPEARPKVSVELTGAIATLSIELGVRYPASIARVTQQVREELGRRVTELAGVQVRQIDIRVGYLHGGSPAEERTLL